MKILVAGASTYGVKNAGDDAMLEVLCSRLREKVPKCKIFFLARHPEKVFDRVHKVKSIKNVEFDFKKQSKGKWFYGFNPDDSTTHLKKIRKVLEEIDLVIIGGNAFMEVSSNNFMKGVSSYCALIATWARLFEKPFALYGVNGTSLKNDITKENAKFLCNNASVCTIREKFFKKELIKSGVNSKKLKVFTDPVYGLKPIFNSKKGFNILKNENIKINKKHIVGICFRHAYWSWDEQKFQKYSLKVALLCDFLSEKLNAEILFIPNSIYTKANPFQDDRYISEIISKKIKNKKHVHIIKGDLSLPERLSIYSLLDLVITNRRHVSIFSAIHNVPFVSIGDDLVWQMNPFIEQLEMHDLLISLNNSNKVIERKILKIWKNREKISNTLSKKIPKLRQTSLNQVDLISDLLTQNEIKK